MSWGILAILDAERAAHAETRRELEEREDCWRAKVAEVEAERDDARRERDEWRAGKFASDEDFQRANAARFAAIAERNEARERLAALVAACDRLPWQAPDIEEALAAARKP